MRRCLAPVFALLSLASLAQARDITGQLTYLPRIALPDGAQMVVELRGPGGVTVAEARIETGGRQVPLPFTVVAPDAGAFTLQGAVFAGGAQEWLSAPVAVPEGEAAVDLGQVVLTRPVSLGFATRLDCGGTPVSVGFTDRSARLRTDAGVLDLKPVAAASGARYSDGQTPETAVWNKGNMALVTVKGRDLQDCQPVITPAALPFTARGNEPGWVLTLSDSGVIYDGDMGARRLEGPLPPSQPTGSGARFDVSPDFSFTLDQALCRDTMTGMPHPVTVSLTDGGRALNGCGGLPGDLLAGHWRVTEVERAAVAEGIEVDMTFDPASGRVFGGSGCNRYNGGFTLTGEGLTFGAAAGTMMACPDDQMTVEQAFLRGLTTVSRFDIGPDGTLVLLSGDTPVIRAQRQENQGAAPKD